MFLTKGLLGDLKFSETVCLHLFCQILLLKKPCLRIGFNSVDNYWGTSIRNFIKKAEKYFPKKGVFSMT